MTRPTILDFIIGWFGLSSWSDPLLRWLTVGGWREKLVVLVYGTALYLEEWRYWRKEGWLR